MATLILAEEANEKIIDVGSGKPKSFNEIIDLIKKQIPNADFFPAPKFIDAPTNYIEETAADTKILHKYYHPMVGMERGIKKLIEHLQGYSEKPETEHRIEL